MGIVFTLKMPGRFEGKVLKVKKGAAGEGKINVPTGKFGKTLGIEAVSYVCGIILYDTIPIADATGIADIRALLKPEAIIAALSGTNKVYELLGDPIPFNRLTKFVGPKLAFTTNL